MLFCFVYRPPSALTEWYKHFELQVQNEIKNRPYYYYGRS